MPGINKEEATKKNKTEQGSSLLIEFSAGSLVLCFDVDCDPGLEFHGEVVGKNGYSIDVLFSQRLGKLHDAGFLIGDKESSPNLCVNCS